VFEGATRLWDSVITAALPFLSNQRSADHFEFFGLDIIPDQAGKCWLIEINRSVCSISTADLGSGARS
jgi:Tubulin-tyrosine ligase family